MPVTLEDPSTTVDPRHLRACLGQFATGVTVVTTAADDGTPHGVTVNSFTSVSLDPPLVLVSIDRRARSCDLLRGRPFVVTVLASTQVGLAWQFAGRPDPALQVPWADRGGVPGLAGGIAHVTCRPFQAVDGGDHVLFLGEVTDLGTAPGDPLLFHAGRFRLAGPSLDERPFFGWLDGLPDRGWFG